MNAIFSLLFLKIWIVKVSSLPPPCFNCLLWVFSLPFVLVSVFYVRGLSLNVSWCLVICLYFQKLFESSVWGLGLSTCGICVRVIRQESDILLRTLRSSIFRTSSLGLILSERSSHLLQGSACLQKFWKVGERREWSYHSIFKTLSPSPHFQFCSVFHSFFYVWYASGSISNTETPVSRE